LSVFGTFDLPLRIRISDSANLYRSAGYRDFCVLGQMLGAYKSLVRVALAVGTSSAMPRLHHAEFLTHDAF
jgi:hypothetical protein